MTSHSAIPNRFDEFNNMTYSVSIYIQSPEQYKLMLQNHKKNVKGLELLIQSGGIHNGKSSGANFGATRSDSFHDDFYLDNIQFKSLISGTAVGAAHNSYELNFNVIEPMGITFLESLNKAIIKYNTDLGIQAANFISQTYLMVIRFYGYDEDGKQITGVDTGNSDSAAYTEKWIPFMFTNITFTLEADKVVYSCNAVPPTTQVGNDQIHGTLPFNVSLQGQTLQELLGGEDKRPSKGAVNTGLVQALNNHQKRLLNCQKQEVADEYAIEFQNGSKISDAILVSPGTLIINRSGLPGSIDEPGVFKNATDKNLNLVQDKKIYAISAGMKIMMFLDLAIRSSSYISNQYRTVKDGNKDNSTKVVKRDDKPLNWFKIRPRIELKEFDKIRNTWGYKITYVITEYEVKTVNPEIFGAADCFNVHKEYNYWFTGLNTEVLDFKQEFNFLYYTTFGSTTVAREDTINNSSRLNRRNVTAYRVNTTQSAQGTDNGTGEQGANIASILYSPADQAKVEVRIVGDPDWIAQSELFYGASKTDKIGERLKPDGSINYDTAEVYFSINFNTTVDYDIETGLADVTKKNVTADPIADPGGVSQYSIVYRANTLVTQLTAGKFVQMLEGTVVFLPADCISPSKKKASTTARPSSTRQQALPPECKVDSASATQKRIVNNGRS